MDHVMRKESSDDNLASWIARQKKSMKQNGNQDNNNLAYTMDIMEVGLKIQSANHVWGVPITSLCNHLYGIIQNSKRGKTRVLSTEEEEALI